MPYLPRPSPPHSRPTGASTAFVALSALASFSFIWRGAVRRRGVEAAQRLAQLAALDDDPYVPGLCGWQGLGGQYCVHAGGMCWTV